MIFTNYWVAEENARTQMCFAGLNDILETARLAQTDPNLACKSVHDAMINYQKACPLEEWSIPPYQSLVPPCPAVP